MSGRGAGGQRCQLILQRCLAIQLTKPGNAPEDFWMYDSGYLLFQSFLAANAKCWWAGALAAATAELRYAGYVCPGVLLVGGAPRALETVRGAYSRSVLKPPPTYLICGLGDIEDCIVTPAYQGQFTPLPEALCDCIMDLTSQGQSATLESIRTSLSSKFPVMQTPSQEVVYDTLAQLMQDRKIYQTSRGFFIVTPERRRSRSRSSSRHHDDDCPSPRTLLMSDQEALHQLYGEITTVRDGAITHQCVQTNLADVICGGNPNDKILYGRPNKRRSASFPAPRSLDRRHSLRIFGSSSKYLQRCASTRSLHHKHNNTTDSSSSTDYPPSVESASPKKASLLSRLFRRSGRSKQARAMSTFSAQFPPTEWFNSKAVHLHCVATQTNSKESLQSQTSYVSSYYDGSEISNRSSTLPRRHKRHLSTESGLAGSVHYDHSPVRHSSPSSGSLPRSTLSRSSTNKTMLDHFGSPQRNSDPKLRDSPSGSLRRVDYAHSDHIMSTSGPSSLESTTTHRTPRKDSRNGSEQNSPMKRNYHTSGSSGHSSLESHISDRTLKPSPSHSNAPGLSRAQSLVKVQSLQSSPKSLHKYRNKPPMVGGETKNGKISPRTSPKNCPSTPKKTATPLHNKAIGPKAESPSPTMMPSANANNSITLKVTTNTISQNGGTNTKVYVQNSPVRSVITFENGKVTETSNGSNIYIINDDRQVVSVSQNGVGNQTAKNPTETSFETCVEKNNQLYQDTEPIKVQENKFNKNSINDTGMNNNRKLSLQIGATNNNSFIYKNQLNNSNEVASNPASPAIHNNINNLDNTTNSNPSTPTKSYDNIIGSLGSLRYQKNSLTSANGGLQTNINSNSELKSVDLLKKAAALQMLNGLPNVNNRMSSDSIANLLSKGVEKPTVLGSEPNLALKNQDTIKDINTSTEKINSLENKQKRYSLSQESKKEKQDFYNFPSLSDLSFNFTSLAAQKILKGVSINSVDTLVELNMAATTEKQNNRDVAAVCTDFGLV
ncbi:probable serine/threonine-protein kinase DDB_G0267686 [Cydia splendana]|uniref:probable serine/threonine-protein kinase DDB_G0267686 n=1 Tax=Cydia splendana TaxID=1100963 RepID=UPI00213C70A6